jgi:small subunit ribosomal protein S6
MWFAKQKVIAVAGLSQNDMREYETLYILKPELEDAPAIEFITKMKSLVEANGGKHIKITNWGRKKLAWERDGNQKGMFVHHLYLGMPGLVNEYERALGIAEDCLLRQTVLVAKGISPDSRQPEEDVLEPPAVKERREDERPRRDDDRPRRDRDDRPRRDDDDRPPRRDRD